MSVLFIAIVATMFWPKRQGVAVTISRPHVARLIEVNVGETGAP
jgi:hypothetical protein